MNEMFDEAKETMMDAAKEAVKLEQKTGGSKGGTIAVVATGTAIVIGVTVGIVKFFKSKRKKYIETQSEVDSDVVDIDLDETEE